MYWLVLQINLDTISFRLHSSSCMILINGFVPLNKFADSLYVVFWNFWIRCVMHTKFNVHFLCFLCSKRLNFNEFVSINFKIWYLLWICCHIILKYRLIKTDSKRYDFFYYIFIHFISYLFSHRSISVGIFALIYVKSVHTVFLVCRPNCRLNLWVRCFSQFLWKIW